MNSRQRRVRAIELTLTPHQVVMVWLRNAMQAGTFEEGARHSPPYRGTVANGVFRTVTESMKGQPESLIERAVLQARREADLLYLLAVKANMEVMENGSQRDREYVFLLGYLSAEMNERVTKDRVQQLRFAVLLFVESVIILDAAIVQVGLERFNGEPVLFRDSEVKLQEQLQMAEALTEHFNFFTSLVDIAPINLEDLRKSLQSDTERKVAIWVNLARVEMLNVFGRTEEMHAAMDQFSRLFGPESGAVEA